MHKTSFHILRVGLAITFLWIGILIFKAPEAWGGFISPWALKLLPVSIEQAMIGTAFLDIIVGALLLFDTFVWVAALAATIHLIIVLAVSGINEVTVRDIAILAGATALFFDSMPASFIEKLYFNKIKIL